MVQTRFKLGGNRIYIVNNVTLHLLGPADVPAQLFKGQKMKVNICDTLTGDGKLMLCDLRFSEWWL
jgi:ABC-type methionine transport system ATPase subunit